MTPRELARQKLLEERRALVVKDQTGTTRSFVPDPEDSLSWKEVASQEPVPGAADNGCGISEAPVAPQPAPRCATCTRFHQPGVGDPWVCRDCGAPAPRGVVQLAARDEHGGGGVGRDPRARVRNLQALGLPLGPVRPPGPGAGAPARDGAAADPGGAEAVPPVDRDAASTAGPGGVAGGVGPVSVADGTGLRVASSRGEVTMAETLAVPAGPPEGRRGKCRSCPATVVWFTNPRTGKANPLNDVVIRASYTGQKLTSGHNVILTLADGRTSRMVADDTGEYQGRESHFSSCPGAAHHRSEP